MDTLAHFPSPDNSYPWNVWMDGQVHKIVRGVDYAATSVNLRTRMYKLAAKRGMRVRTVMTPESLTFQFYRPEDDE